RNLWSWVVLKAYTRNHRGIVRLRSDDPFACPDICFDSFNERAEKVWNRLLAAKQRSEATGYPSKSWLETLSARIAEIRVNSERDVNGMLEAIKAMRAVNAQNKQFRKEIQPGATRPRRDERPTDPAGLAISGGAIRSATFALGFLQALAERGRLRRIDFLSTGSGGGFIGSFLGRLFTRSSVTASKDPCGRVQDIIRNTASAPIWWLRTQANYIFATGASDLRQNLAIYWRNLFTVHLIIGVLLFALFASLQVASTYLPPAPQLPIFQYSLSPWWW